MVIFDKFSYIFRLAYSYISEFFKKIKIRFVPFFKKLKEISKDPIAKTKEIASDFFSEFGQNLYDIGQSIKNFFLKLREPEFREEAKTFFVSLKPQRKHIKKEKENPPRKKADFAKFSLPVTKFILIMLSAGKKFLAILLVISIIFAVIAVAKTGDFKHPLKYLKARFKLIGKGLQKALFTKNGHFRPTKNFEKTLNDFENNEFINNLMKGLGWAE